jgi:hypothetical protein
VITTRPRARGARRGRDCPVPGQPRTAADGPCRRTARTGTLDRHRLPRTVCACCLSLLYVVPVLAVDHLPDAGAPADGGQWDVYWTSRDAQISQGFLPLLDEWSDIDDRERALGIEAGTPILMDPAGRVDPRLARFLSRSRFSRLAEGTRKGTLRRYCRPCRRSARPRQPLGRRSSPAATPPPAVTESRDRRTRPGSWPPRHAPSGLPASLASSRSWTTVSARQRQETTMRR